MQNESSLIINQQDTSVLKKLVTSLLREKPNDPVPFIYSFLSQVQAGAQQPKAVTNIEIAQIKNLHLKIEELKGRLKSDHELHAQTESSADEDSEEEIETVQKKEVSKKQRAGVSAEVFGQYNKKEDFVAKIIQKSAETKAKLSNRLLQAFMFNALEAKELNIVIDAIEEIRVSAGEKVIVEGDQGDCMYVLESGSLDCTKIFSGKTEPTFLKTYQPGEGFGELALLYNCPRAATITAKSDSIVWRLDRDTFNNIVKDAAQKKRERYDEQLKSVQILQTMDPYERSKLSDALKEEQYDKDAFIIREGEIGEKFFFIVEGTAIATKRLNGTKESTTVMEYHGGQYFGERALLTNEVRAANILATSDCVRCLSIERETFSRLLGPLGDLLKRNMDVYKKYSQ